MDAANAARAYDYDVPANAKRVVTAMAFRRGGHYTVLVADVDQAIAEKRASQFGKISQRLQPADYRRETFKGRTAHKFDEQRLKQVSDFVEHMRKEYDVPGVAIGIVQDGKTVMAKGFGVRSLDKPAKVDADTRFMIASNTKALTTLMLAKLVDAGKLDWNAHVTDVYPAFKLGSAETTKQVLVKHLICACTGLPRQDYEWLFEGEKQTPESVMSTLGTPRSPVGNSQIEGMLVQLRDRQIAREQMETYERQEAAAVKERTLREAAAVAAQQKSLTESRIAIEIAENNGLAQVKTQTRQGEADAAKIRNVAIADAERIRAIGAANANRIELEGEATARAAQKQVEAYGGPEIRLAQEISAQITKALGEGKMAVVPQVVVGGDGSNTNAIEAITAMIMAAGQEFRNRRPSDTAIVRNS